ncbi:hypothetical protein DXB93_08025 [Thomasclavelia ramosa]|uniref:Uncharacterized protein n=1 Tax=Thomasclavelia ramosa TaxID=1547 RepID=A0A3E3EF48_9FIRM|nr:hypothetical protein DXB93_08025 [Thomasclavelia ramosa]
MASKEDKRKEVNHKDSPPFKIPLIHGIGASQVRKRLRLLCFKSRGKEGEQSSFMLVTTIIEIGEGSRRQ